MDSTPTTRRRNRSPRGAPASTQTQAQTRSVAPVPSSARSGPDLDWIEPPLVSPIPSFEEHGGGPYGVLEDMQALGTRPSAKVRGRVKPEVLKKGALGKSLANPLVTASTPGTPEATPAPVEALAEQPLIIVDDERDDDYTPRPSKKSTKARLSRASALASKSTQSPKPDTRSALASETPAPSSIATPAASVTPAIPSQAPTPTRVPTPVPASAPAPPAASAPARPDRNGHDIKLPASFYVSPRQSEADVTNHMQSLVEIPTSTDSSSSNLHNIVIEAFNKSQQVGNKYLGLALLEMYKDSLTTKPHLAALLLGILHVSATPEEEKLFKTEINKAKKKIKAEHAAADKTTSNNTSASRETKFSKAASSPAPTPASAPTPAPAPNSSLVAHPSIETQTVPRKPKISLKMSKSSKDTTMSEPSPSTATLPPPPRPAAKPRASSVSSSSSLSSLTSIEEDEEEPVPPSWIALQTLPQGATSSTLITPSYNNASLKRSSVESGIDDSDREFQAKKQKMDATVNRDAPVEESHVRPDLSAVSKVHKNPIVPPVQLTANGARSRHISTDGASPLTDMSSPLSSTSRKHTPKEAHIPSDMFKKKAKTKHSPVKKQVPGQSADEDGTSRRASPIGPDVHEDSDNNDFCAACNTSGYLLCCDGCDRSFHFGCLDPPLTQDASELLEPWYCFRCIAKRAQPERQSRGLFASLLSNLDKRNPSNFLLPQEIRDYFDGVASTKDGKFVEQPATKTRRGAGYDELPDNFKTKDAKGQAILCCHCGLSSLGRREIITCDQCSAHWHLDCLDPPLANPPYRDHTGRKIREWLCPLHVDHVLREMDVPRLADRQLQRDRRVHMRRPRGAKVVDTALRRGFINNGVIEIAPDSSDDDSEFEEVEVSGVVYRLPEKGIKLDFIDKVKRSRPVAQYYNRNSPCARPTKRRRLDQSGKHDFFRRSFLEQRTALDLVSLADEQADLDFNGDQVSGLLATLIAEAPADVVAQMVEAEKNIKSIDTAAPPSPPVSEQQAEQNLTQQRKTLELLQTLIARKLAALPS